MVWCASGWRAWEPRERIRTCGLYSTPARGNRTSQQKIELAEGPAELDELELEVGLWFVWIGGVSIGRS